MIKRLLWLGIVLIFGCGALVAGCHSGDAQDHHNSPSPAASGTIVIPRIQSEHDQDDDGIRDADDILVGARRDAANKPTYVDKYYEGGYPPDNEGVCSDVVWRAFKEAGYNLKSLVDQDVRENLKEYSGVLKPDPNIDFRRVVNLNVFFKRHAQALTLKIIPNDIANLKEWQGGDLVIFGSQPPNNHIAVVSDRRRSDGVPYLIHNDGPYTEEEDAMMRWSRVNITGHYRWWRD